MPSPFSTAKSGIPSRLKSPLCDAPWTRAAPDTFRARNVPSPPPSKDLNIVIGAIHHANIKFAVAIQIRQFQIKRSVSHRVSSAIRECSVAFAKQNRDRAILVVVGDQIDLAIAVKIACRQSNGMVSHCLTARQGESPVAIAKTNRNRVSSTDRHGDIELAIVIKIADCE